MRGGSPCETNVLISKLGFVSVLQPKDKGQWNCPHLKNRKMPPLLSFNILAWDILPSLLFKEEGFSFGVMKPSLTTFTLILKFIFLSFLIWIGEVAKKLTTKFVDFYKMNLSDRTFIIWIMIFNYEKKKNHKHAKKKCRIV